MQCKNINIKHNDRSKINEQKKLLKYTANTCRILFMAARQSENKEIFQIQTVR